MLLTHIHPRWGQNSTFLSLFEVDAQPQRHLNLQAWVKWTNISLKQNAPSHYTGTSTCVNLPMLYLK